MHPRVTNPSRECGRDGCRRNARRGIVAELPDLVLEDIPEALRYAAQSLLERELPLRKPA